MLIALLISAAEPSAPVLNQHQLGYPIFVRSDDGRCGYQIQDMILHDEAQVSDWMRNRLLRGRVDIVVGGDSPKQCIANAKLAVQQAGYSNIVIRHGSESDYGWLGPPR